MARGNEWTLDDAQFNTLRSLVYKHTGISLSDAKRELVKRRFASRLRSLKLNDFNEYCRLLESGGGQQEIPHFTNAITTNLTAFFRENHHFEALQEILCRKAQASPLERRLRIWSAGCSTGEEPYSIAMCLQEHFPSLHAWDVKILATDIDTEVLAKASAGCYARERFADMPKDLRERWFQSDDDGYRACFELKHLIQFNQLNLMHSWPMRGQFDAVFCRNVIIYFDIPTKTELLQRFAEVIKPGGHLFLGHSESLPRGVDQFELQGKTIYRRLEGL